MCRGLPASGKSWWAKEQVLKGQGNVKRVNKDELRVMVDASKFSHEREKEIIGIRDMLVSRWIERGHTVIVDDTNYHPSHEQTLRDIAKMYGVDFAIKDFSDVPLGTCLERNRERTERRVPESYILQEWMKYVKPTPEYIEGVFPAVICDLDGTMALLNGRSPYDASTCEADILNPLVKHVWNSFDPDTHVKIIMSGRDGKHRPETERWLKQHWIRHHALFMRDEGDQTKDEIIKRNMYETHVKGQYNVVAVIDDRPKVIRMWQYDLGLPVLNVGYNIEF